MATRRRTLLLLACMVLIPAWANAQSTLAGVVQDSSGGVLPGVTVEASSPVLIEKVRTALTDTTGQYRFTGLTPGVYTGTFRLSGFSVVRRDGVELSGAGVTTIGAELRIGALEETITGTGATPGG